MKNTKEQMKCEDCVFCDPSVLYCFPHRHNKQPMFKLTEDEVYEERDKDCDMFERGPNYAKDI